MATLHAYKPDHAAPPGALLQDYLEHLDISGRELARRCGRSPKLIAEILLGKAPVEPETALQLERVLELSATIWLGLEANYRLRLARDHEEKRLAGHIDWARKFPLKDLAKRGVLKTSTDAAMQVRELLGFFGCGSVDACEDRFKELRAAAFRHSPAFESNTAALLAWLRIGDLVAEKSEAADFDRAKFLAALKRIRRLTLQSVDVFLPEVRRLCAEAGVVFLLEPALPKVSLSGVSRWLTPRRALIQQTVRHLSNDHFWFTFFHECAHLLLHSRKDIFLDGNGISNSDPELEAEANDWAADFLVPADAMTRFITRFTYDPDQVIAFAKRHGVAPGIVVGQLQHRKVLPFSRMNELKVHFAWTND
jgi:HTH-type transcriptional regulator/antitoxin HigA